LQRANQATLIKFDLPFALLRSAVAFAPTVTVTFLSALSERARQRKSHASSP
jgi:hypothetical protein